MHANGFPTVDGRRLEVSSIAGPPGRPTIVLLHEGLGSVSMWRDFPHALAARTGCAVLTYSRYGHGRSAPLEARRDVDYMHHEALVVLPDLLEQYGVTRPILYGHSDGASIALIYAARHADGVAALILEAPHVFVEEITVASIAAIKNTFEASDLRQRMARHHADPVRTFYGWNDIWLDPRFRLWNIEAGLENITAPVLLLQGSDDEYGTLKQIEAITARCPTTRVVLLEGCGHAPHREGRAAVLAALGAFTDEL